MHKKPKTDNEKLRDFQRQIKHGNLPESYKKVILTTCRAKGWNYVKDLLNTLDIINQQINN